MQSPLSYIGGKNRLRETIVSLIPEHHTYVELFAGGAQVLFAKKVSTVEILNDLSHDVVTFFRVCQLHSEELTKYLTSMVAGRHWFDLLQKTDPFTLTDIQRAARFLFLQKTCYGGLVRRRNFVLGIERNKNFRAERMPELIAQARERLQNVQIECRPYDEVIKRCDRKGTFFYLDPPYWGKKLYEFNFDEKDFIRLEGILRRLKGKFLLSINDLPPVRKLFSRFIIRKTTIAYSSSRDPGKRYAELLIRNY